VQTHDVAEMWNEYTSTRDLELRNRLVLQYSPLVKYVVGRVLSGLPSSVDQADLLSEGVIGLMDAIEKFEPRRGLQFQTYAISRIRGAMIDSLRATDWVPRSVRDSIRAIERAQVALEVRLGRTATDAEIAHEMKISVPDLQAIYTKASYTSLGSLNELEGVGELAALSTDVLEDDEARAAVMHAVQDLSERERILIALYYFEGLTLSEIGRVLGVTESRVSQLHTKTALALRAKLVAAAAAV